MPLMPLGTHRLSWAQRKQLHERLTQRAGSLRSVAADDRELSEIDAALARLESSSTYGACADCGAPIAWDRLLAQPQLQRCTRCHDAEARARA